MRAMLLYKCVKGAIVYKNSTTKLKGKHTAAEKSNRLCSGFFGRFLLLIAIATVIANVLERLVVK